MTYPDKLRRDYKSDFRNFLGSDEFNVNLFWKGRVALYAILKALDIKKGDEIILPAFTCVAVSAPIIYLKAKPVYIDIDPLTYNIDPQLIEKNISSRTKAILVQNTFGLSSDMDAVLSAAEKKKIAIIEDCSHGIGSRYKGKINGTITGISFFSSQWNKMYSTGIGGMTAVKDKDLYARISAIEDSAIEPAAFEKLNLKTLLFFRKNFSAGQGYFFLQNMYRNLSRFNLVVGSNQGNEFDEIAEPRNYLKKMSPVQARQGSENIKNISANIKHRKSAAAKYREIFNRIGMPIAESDIDYDHVYIKFSFLVDDKPAFLALAEKARLEMSDWFVSPVHSIINNIEQWGYTWGSNPVAEKVCRHIVNLPTHEGIDENFLDKAEDFLNKNKKRLIAFEALR